MLYSSKQSSSLSAYSKAYIDVISKGKGKVNGNNLSYLSSSKTKDSSGLYLLNNLEKYFDDRSKSRANYFSNIPAKISRISQSQSSLIAATDFKAIENYQGYLTALNEERRSRFIYGVGTAKNVMSLFA